MRKRLLEAVLLFLIALPSAAWADNQPDQRNVYDAFRQWLKPSADASVDEQVTALVKRHMATLLYPVDMSSFARPETDQKFRDLIMVLQKQLGVPVTGILTSDQFDRLAQATRDIDSPVIGLQPSKMVGVAQDGSWASASGTVAMVSGDDVAHKINHTRIMCIRAEGTCDMVSASFDLNTRFLWLDLPTVAYVIKAWTSHTILAESQGPCGIDASLTLDIVAKTVTISSNGSCVDKRPSTYSLVDGFPVAWKLHQDSIDKARTLVYAPAQKFMPNQK